MKNLSLLLREERTGEGKNRDGSSWHQPNSPWTEIIKIFPSRESLVGDIPAGDGKKITVFTVYVEFNYLMRPRRGQ